MKIINEKTKTVSRYTIDYENNVYCDVVIEDKKLKKYSFYLQTSDDELISHLNYVDDINILLDNHWSDHWELLGTQPQVINKVEDLIYFREFNKLFYIGGHTNGLLMDYTGKKLSSVQYIDESHTQIYHNITKMEQANKLIEKCKNFDWVISCEVLKIPHYNHIYENSLEEHSVYLQVKLPQELLDRAYDETKEKHFGSEMKEWVVNHILNS